MEIHETAYSFCERFSVFKLEDRLFEKVFLFAARFYFSVYQKCHSFFAHEAIR